MTIHLPLPTHSPRRCGPTAVLATRIAAYPGHVTVTREHPTGALVPALRTDTGDQVQNADTVVTATGTTSHPPDSRARPADDATTKGGISTA